MIENSDRKPLQIKLSNINGSLILFKDSKTNENQIQLSLSGIKNGIYFLSVESGGKTITEKLIIN